MRTTRKIHLKYTENTWNTRTTPHTLLLQQVNLFLAYYTKMTRVKTRVSRLAHALTDFLFLFFFLLPDSKQIMNPRVLEV